MITPSSNCHSKPHLMMAASSCSQAPSSIQLTHSRKLATINFKLTLPTRILDDSRTMVTPSYRFPSFTQKMASPILTMSSTLSKTFNFAKVATFRQSTVTFRMPPPAALLSPRIRCGQSQRAARATATGIRRSRATLLAASHTSMLVLTTRSLLMSWCGPFRTQQW